MFDLDSKVTKVTVPFVVFAIACGLLSLTFYGWIGLAAVATIFFACTSIFAIGDDVRKGNWLRGIYWFVAMLPSLIGIYAWIYTQTGLQRGENAFTPQWSEAIYFSIVTWTTLGYGDISPGPQAQLWASIEVLLGYIYMGLLVGIIVAFVAPSQSPTQPPSLG